MKQNQADGRWAGRGRGGIAVVVCCFALSTAWASSQEDVSGVLCVLGAQFERIQDMSAVLCIQQGGTKNPEFIRNRIETVKVLRAEGHVPADLAEQQMRQLERELADPPSYACPVLQMQWLRRSDGLFRVTQPVRPGSEELVSLAYDGVTTKWYYPAKKRGAVRNDRPMPLRNPDFALSFNGTRLDDFITQAQQNGNVSVEPEALPDGRGPLLAVTARAPSDPTALDRHYLYAKFWLDPAAGCMPRRIEQGTCMGPGDEAPLIEGVVEDVSLSEVSPGVWFPVAARIARYDIANLADPAKPMEKWPLVSFGSTSWVKMELREVAVNQDLADEDFSIEFAPGTVVYDHFTETRLLAGRIEDSIEQEVLAALLAEGTSEPPAAGPAVAGSAPATLRPVAGVGEPVVLVQEAPPRTGLIAAAAGGIGLAAVFLGLRAMCRKKVSAKHD